MQKEEWQAMDNFKVIYKILRYLERCMDLSERDMAPISAEALGIRRERWLELVAMLADNGYISGVVAECHVGVLPMIGDVDNMRITMKGLEYLQENGLMRKAAELVRCTVEVVFR